MKANLRSSKTLTVALVLVFINVIVILISLNTGSLRIAPMEVVRTLLGFGDNKTSLVLFEYRLPRIIITILAGIGLGISGAILQGVSRNPLADPGIIGLHAGASFGLVMFVTYFHSLNDKAALLIPLFTFVGGCLTALIIILLTYDRYKGILPIRLILVGIAIAACFNAITLFLSLRLDEDTYTFASRWLVGNVWGRDWIHVIALLPWIVILTPFGFLQSRKLDAISLGDNTAVGLGVSVLRTRLSMLAIAVALSSASVAMVGGIGFIGLVAPHLARRLVGPRHQHFLPVAGLLGMVILVLSDTVGRSIFQPNAIPAGIVVAAIGGPYFLYLLTKTK
ncbi:iron ABC transporter permease [Niallia taxi]|uniref:Iron ABC transporter permease n=1 Tax=Niallia taxi TaxID=2499688 RepID=A0A437KAF2_9BACI|nr:iron ABC transporter permease [Niallia taxi]MDK8640632.1 iron ABC transporter permease [Niallia taxi]MED4036095.1 iron ABC transporter permease [Niallia taxi]RVT62418.1 iron ABC transporter permease [Niallia taxi]